MKQVFFLLVGMLIPFSRSFAQGVTLGPFLLKPYTATMVERTDSQIDTTANQMVVRSNYAFGTEYASNFTRLLLNGFIVYSGTAENATLIGTLAAAMPLGRGQTVVMPSFDIARTTAVAPVLGEVKTQAQIDETVLSSSLGLNIRNKSSRASIGINSNLSMSTSKSLESIGWNLDETVALAGRAGLMQSLEWNLNSLEEIVVGQFPKPSTSGKARFSLLGRMFWRTFAGVVYQQNFGRAFASEELVVDQYAFSFKLLYSSQMIVNGSLGMELSREPGSQASATGGLSAKLETSRKFTFNGGFGLGSFPDIKGLIRRQLFINSSVQLSELFKGHLLLKLGWSYQELENPRGLRAQTGSILSLAGNLAVTRYVVFSLAFENIDQAHVFEYSLPKTVDQSFSKLTLSVKATL